jgi:hypothetical protein
MELSNRVSRYGVTLCIAFVSAAVLLWTPFGYSAENVRNEVARAHLYTTLASLPAAAGVILACRVLPEQRPQPGP